MTAQAAPTPVTPQVLSYLKSVFPPAMIDRMVAEKKYEIVEQKSGHYERNSNKN